MAQPEIYREPARNAEIVLNIPGEQIAPPGRREQLRCKRKALRRSRDQLQQTLELIGSASGAGRKIQLDAFIVSAKFKRVRAPVIAERLIHLVDVLREPPVRRAQFDSTQLLRGAGAAAAALISGAVGNASEREACDKSEGIGVPVSDRHTGYRRIGPVERAPGVIHGIRRT